MSDDIETIEKRAYARGYAAGRKKAKAIRDEAHRRRERQAFLDRAFLAALPFAMEQSTWEHDGKKIDTVRDRVDLAWRVAMTSVAARRMAP
ncbi:hypothetical protein [Massilia timonae]|uniref:hypothetical protein n=1 Tax=Massilia timonae TaxID=47229 RepID=UPI002897DD49|nr:hypothetical protein [Massilia timonae]